MKEPRAASGTSPSAPSISRRNEYIQLNQLNIVNRGFPIHECYIHVREGQKCQIHVTRRRLKITSSSDTIHCSLQVKAIRQ